MSWLLGHLVPYSVTAATNSQVAGRVTRRLVDLVAALATGSVGSVALARPDISDTVPGVAIAISLVPPLAVAGLTLQSGEPSQSLGALLLFATNVAAILASGIVVMALYRTGRASGQATDADFHRPAAVVIIALLLLAVLVPLWINSERIDKTTIRQADVQAVAEHWVSEAGWSVIGVTATGDRVLIDATGPNPAPTSLSSARTLTPPAWAASTSGSAWSLSATSPCRSSRAEAPWRHRSSIVADARRVPDPGRRASGPGTAAMRACRCQDGLPPHRPRPASDTGISISVA